MLISLLTPTQINTTQILIKTIGNLKSMILWIFVKIFELALTIKNSTHHNLDVRDLINFDTHLN